MSGRERDDGLSEVIGFILIIGLLVIIASLYMTYMVPAQGREAEIQHMDYIKQQFLDYKINTDALWINNAVGTAITQSIKLGTEQQETSGSFAGFGIMKPVGSTGTLRINPDSIADNFTIGITGAVFASDNYTSYPSSTYTYTY
ncbi:MAG: hypothetical protein LUQ07_03895, partial [Methanospirillum sp.]|nr:hypothetical protein [Methanospirillum sp.]